MASLVMGRGQIEQPWGQHTSIISIVSLVQRQSKAQARGSGDDIHQQREMKLMAACIPKGDQDLVHVELLVNFFSLFLSVIIAQA